MDFLLGRKVVKRVFVTPTTHEARQFKTNLNGLDAAFFLVPEVPVAWVWKNHKLDFELLRIGLENTLNRIPSAGGRVRAGKKFMEISNVDSKGCLFEFQIDQKLPHEDAPANAWKKYGVAEAIIPLEPFDIPLVTATLTHFEEGGCCLFVRFSHLLADGSSMVKFMQVWSWETAMVANRSHAEAMLGVLPNQNPPDVECSHQLPVKDIPIEPVDLAKRLTLFRTFQFLTRFPLVKATDEVADFEFTLESWNLLKKKMESNLSKGQWISSYEAFMGLVLNCMAKAENTLNIDARAVVNIRGRSSLFNQNYFGVGLSIHQMDSLPGSLNDPADTALAMHESLRKALQETTEMEKLVKLPEVFRAIELGPLGSLFGGRELIVDRARYLAVWENCISENKCVINSWVGYPWLDMNFGLLGGKSSCPNFMRVPQEFRFRRHIHVCPKGQDTFQLRMQLPSKLMQAFRREFKASGFEFREVKTGQHHKLAEPSLVATNRFDLVDSKLQKKGTVQQRFKPGSGASRALDEASYLSNRPVITARL